MNSNSEIKTDTGSKANKKFNFVVKSLSWKEKEKANFKAFKRKTRSLYLRR